MQINKDKLNGQLIRRVVFSLLVARSNDNQNKNLYNNAIDDLESLIEEDDNDEG